ncbi:hypothetical protein [Burkholderia ubonensis]|uniref:hypothetical protein n=1 Tax=Burkholderia ubonensis TaxID=101571 RepID=UPI000754CCC4|nr:hypothetical protein [Burkholderia ubonensis]KVL85535.1 hypothetical protein WJ50_20355 [Burkholderia ubonensis]
MAETRPVSVTFAPFDVTYEIISNTFDNECSLKRMENSLAVSPYALAVYFYGGIQYCFESAPRDMPSMDEVNRKLAQIVWQETGPSNVPISARRDGFLIFDFDKSPNFAQVPSTTFDEKIMRERQELAHQRFQYMNAFLMALHSGLAETMQTGTPVQSPLNPTSYYKAFEHQGHWLITDTSIRQVEGSNFLAQDIKLAALDHALHVMARCGEVFEDDGLKILALCLTAGNQLTLHQYESAHLIAWSVIEKSLNKVWASLVHELDARNGGHTEMNGDRRRMLLEGHDYTASIVTQMLSFHKRIDDDMLARLNDARRTRNNFAHSLRPVKWDDAARAINTANELISKVVGTKVHCQAALQWHG